MVDVAAASLADLLASLSALGRSMRDGVDPHRFLSGFSPRVERLIPHDRLVIDLLDEDGRTFSVFAEHAERGPRFSDPNPAERRLREAGFRSGVLVPLVAAGRVIGALVATSFARGVYTGEHLGAARQVADLIAPFIENVVRLERERRRRRRLLRALSALPQVLGQELERPRRSRRTPSGWRPRSAGPRAWSTSTRRSCSASRR